MFYHKPIMVDDVIHYLNIKENGIYIDCTTGGGGHSYEIAKRLKGGRLICIDQDQDALNFAKKRLEKYNSRVTFIKSNYAQYDKILESQGLNRVDGVLLDIGISSFQIDTPKRGFAYMEDGPLDMRMDQEQKLTAAYVVNNYSKDELIRIFKEYGEEKYSKSIAEGIVRQRQISSINTTFDLVEIINRLIPPKAKYKMKGHPAKRIFQSIRIEVNGELFVLETVLPKIIHSLSTHGRLVVLTFHSLEDRIVKKCFKEFEKDCTCPPDIPICVCNKMKEIKFLHRKVITASEKEIKQNPRAKSCKLRAIEKIQ